MDELRKSIEQHNLFQKGSVENLGNQEDLMKALPIGSVNKYGKTKTEKGWVYVKKGKKGAKAEEEKVQPSTQPKKKSEKKSEKKPQSIGQAVEGHYKAEQIFREDLHKIGKESGKGYTNVEDRAPAIEKFNNNPAVKAVKGFMKDIGANIEFPRQKNENLAVDKYSNTDNETIERNKESNKTSIRRVTKTLSLLSQPKVKKQLAGITGDLEGNHPKIVHAESNGKDGIFLLMAYSNDFAGSAGARFIAGPNGLILINEDLLRSQDKSRDQKIANKLLAAIDKEAKPVEVTDLKNTLPKVKQILSKMPSGNAVVKVGGFKVDVDNGIIEVDVDTSREARHPDEYGERGERASQLAGEWDSNYYNTVVDPLEKLGWEVSTHSFR